VVAARQIAAELSKCSITSDDRYPELLRLFLQVAGTMAAIATKLQLTPQSSRDSRHTKLVPPEPYPWERDNEEAEESPLAAMPEDDGDEHKNERNFNVLLQQQRARRSRAMLATEALDVAAFRGDVKHAT
jgi:hypothetical protein